MKKKNLLILSLLIVSLMVGVVMAFGNGGDITITVYRNGEFISPEEGYVNGNVLISWENVEDAYLKYQEGLCDSLPGGTKLIEEPIASDGSYEWDTTKVEDGKYCIKLTWSEVLDNISVTVDNTKPEIKYFVVDKNGKESDASTPETKTKVSFDYEDEIDSEPEWEIDWGDGTVNSKKRHQYGDDGKYKIILTVKDAAGNTETASDYANVKNVAPTVGSINVQSVGAVGEEIEFSAVDVDDVEADMDSLIYDWDFDGDGDVVGGTDESPVYAYDKAGEYTVTLTIEDKDGGESEEVEKEIEIFDVEAMTPMQKVVVGNNFKFNLDEPWAVNNKKRFKTEIFSITNCEEVVVPAGMILTPKGDNRCQVDWTPTKEQRGEHTVIIKARNSTDFKYYSFDVTVYSWGIKLVPGWNLVSIPLMPKVTSINSVLGGIIENVADEGSSYTVFQYDAVKNKWYRARKYSSNSGYTATSNRLTDIIPGYAYWIKMENADVLYGTEEPFEVDQVPVPSVDLATASWNLIGKYGLSAPLQISKALRSLEDYYFKPILELDGTSWNPAETMSTGQGYWVRTKIAPEIDEGIIEYFPLGYYFD